MPNDARAERVPVLVVEDDAALRTLFIALLSGAGFAPVCVNDGSEALAALSTSRPPVILLDLMMPAPNGFDVLAHFAATDPTLLRQTIVVTGLAERDLGKIDRAAIFELLRKPFDIDVLLTSVRECHRRYVSAAETGRKTGLESSLRQFEGSLPKLREMLSREPGSDRELMLRHELRRTVRTLGGTLSEAARNSGYSAGATDFQRLRDEVAELASTHPTSGRRLDH